MTTYARKPFNEYFADVVDRIEFKVRCNERTGQVLFFAFVPSSSSSEPYMVGLDNNDNAAWCDCGDHCYRHNVCKHMLAVNRKNAIIAAEAAAIANDKTFEQAKNELVVALDAFYETRGQEASKKLASMKRVDAMDAAPLNGRNTGFSIMAKSLSSK